MSEQSSHTSGPDKDKGQDQEAARQAEEPGKSTAAAGAGSGERERRRALRKQIVAVCLVAGLCLGVVVTRAIWEGSQALADGDAALKQGDLDEAIGRWRRAARWYVPLAPHVSGAYERLEELARQAESRGDVDTALAAWRGIRGSILATRSFYTPHESRLEPANQRIAELMARLEAREPALAQSGETETQRASWHYELLTRDHSPSVFWSVIAILGFALWLGGGLLFALRGVTADDRLVLRNAAYAGIMVATGLFVWMLGLYLA